MEFSLPSTLLDESTDPVMIVGADGIILWSNSAAMHLAGTIAKDMSLERAHLSVIIQPPDARALLKVTYFASLEVRMVKPCPLPPQTAIVLDISSGDPDAERFLITLKSTSPEILRSQGGDDILAGITHDLRNPLGAIFGYADALLDTDAGEGLSSTQREVIARLRRTTSRSIDLVRNYQLLLQLRAVGLREPPSAVDLNEAVTFVVEDTWREDVTSQELQIELTPDSLPVAAERFHIERIIANVFSNALKYTPPNGKIRITTFKDGDYCCLSIQNSGPPISPGELPYMFERYRRASNSAGTSGTGLGLFIVKYIADRIGGRVNFTSNNHEGTTMMVRLPKWKGVNHL